ncbi:hypothetical protein ACXR2T_00735 [Leucobacter sp. HY1910]
MRDELNDAQGALRWDLGWRVGLIGGVVNVLSALVSSAIVFGIHAVVPGASLFEYMLALARVFFAPAVLLGVAAALVARYLGRYVLGLQVLIFGVLLGVVPAAFTVVVRLLGSLAADATLGFSWGGLAEVIGRELVAGMGLPMFVAATLGWTIASMLLRRRAVAPAG